MSNGRGGSRKGAGRKPGIANKRTREIAEQAISEGCAPLEVLLQLMRDAYREGNDEAAGKYAKDAAPYCHPRLSSVKQSVKDHVTVNITSNFQLDIGEY